MSTYLIDTKHKKKLKMYSVFCIPCKSGDRWPFRAESASAWVLPPIQSRHRWPPQCTIWSDRCDGLLPQSRTHRHRLQQILWQIHEINREKSRMQRTGFRKETQENVVICSWSKCTTKTNSRCWIRQKKGGTLTLCLLFNLAHAQDQQVANLLVLSVGNLQLQATVSSLLVLCNDQVRTC